MSAQTCVDTTLYKRRFFSIKKVNYLSHQADIKDRHELYLHDVTAKRSCFATGDVTHAYL